MKIRDFLVLVVLGFLLSNSLNSSYVVSCGRGEVEGGKDQPSTLQVLSVVELCEWCCCISFVQRGSVWQLQTKYIVAVLLKVAEMLQSMM